MYFITSSFWWHSSWQICLAVYVHIGFTWKITQQHKKYFTRCKCCIFYILNFSFWSSYNNMIYTIVKKFENVIDSVVRNLPFLKIFKVSRIRSWKLLIGIAVVNTEIIRYKEKYATKFLTQYFICYSYIFLEVIFSTFDRRM